MASILNPPLPGDASFEHFAEDGLDGLCYLWVFVGPLWHVGPLWIVGHDSLCIIWSCHDIVWRISKWLNWGAQGDFGKPQQEGLRQIWCGSIRSSKVGPRIRMIRSVLHKLRLQNRVLDVFIQAFWLFSMLGYVGHAETSRQTWWPENSTACLACSHCLWREPCMPSPRSLRRKWKLIRANQSFRFLFPPKWQKVEFCSWCTVSLSSSYL